jgi:hypothetical protein
MNVLDECEGNIIFRKQELADKKKTRIDKKSPSGKFPEGLFWLD